MPLSNSWASIAQSKPFVAVFIVANALTAGSIFCFPLFGPTIAADLGLSLTQTNTIWSAAVVGQYASAAVFGNIADTYGPRPLSLLAAVLFGAGYILMAHTESGAILHKVNEGRALDNDVHRANFIAMAAYFLLVGAGVAASIFSALRASTSHFRSHPGLALSIPLTLFSLSSLFLTAFASLSFFTDPQTGDLNGPRWLASLGAALMITNALSAFGLSVPAETAADDQNNARHATDDAGALSTVTSETTPLLATPKPRAHALPYSVPYYRKEQECPIEPILSLREYVSAPGVWMMAFVVFAAVGGAEMVMSSIGSMVVSLRDNVPAGVLDEDDKIRLGKETLALRAQQVQFLAIANTLARLLVGLVSDVLSPRPTTDARQSQGTRYARLQVSRLTMLIGGLILLFVSYVYAAAFLESVDRLWIVSVATGTGYGLTFTLIPSMVVSLWPKQFGRNYGLLTYAAAIGSLCFSILFAQVNDAVANRKTTVPDISIAALSKVPSSLPTASICVYGRSCFAASFTFAACTVAVGVGVAIPLWQSWRHFL